MTTIHLPAQSKKRHRWSRRPAVLGKNKEHLIEMLKQHQKDLEGTLAKKYPHPLSKEEWDMLINLSKYFLLSEKKAPTNEEENLLIDYSERAIAFIIFYYNNWIMKRVRKYSESGAFDYGDLYQEACIGLMRAIELYDPARNVELITYVTIWIEALIRSFVYKNRSPFSIKPDAVQRIRSGRDDKEIPNVVEIEGEEKGEERLLFDQSNLDEDILIKVINEYLSAHPNVSTHTLKSWVEQIRAGKLNSAMDGEDPARQAFVAAVQHWVVRG